MRTRFFTFIAALGLAGGSASAALVASDLDRRHAHCRLRAVIGGVPIADFNDTQTTVRPILVALDRAIAMGR